MNYLLPFLLVFTILVFIHELGHFLAARYYGVQVDVFSIGFGPRILDFTDKKGTNWRFSILPLGGYVKMYGDADVASSHADPAVSSLSEADKQKTLHAKTPFQRNMVAFAGPLANLLFALVAIAMMLAFKGIPNVPSIIGDIAPNSIAQQAGIQKGDTIKRIDQNPISTFREIMQTLPGLMGKSVELEVERNGTTQVIKVDLFTKEPDGTTKAAQVLGISPPEPTFTPVSWYTAIPEAFAITANYSLEIIKTIGRIFTSSKVRESIGGILSMGHGAGESFKAGFWSVIFFMSILSINLGVINLLPVPMLDGGQITINTVEAVIGRSLGEKVKNLIAMIGITLVAGLMLLATWNDVARFGGKIFTNVKEKVTNYIK